MSWEKAMFAVFDDLEQQADGLSLADRDAEVAELSVAEYAQVSLGARLHASRGRHVRIRLRGGSVLSGALARSGEDWLMLGDAGAPWLVRSGAVVSVTGLSPRADHEETWSITDRLGFRALLRRLAGETEDVRVRCVDEQVVDGRVTRVGRDFVELRPGGLDASDQASGLTVLPLDAVAALQGRR